MDDLRGIIRREAAARGLRLVAVARESGLQYERVQRVLGGFRSPRPGELARLADAIERLAPRTGAGGDIA